MYERKTNPTAKKLMWLIELLVEERPRTVFDIASTTQLDRRDVDDATWELVQEGRIRIRPDSKLEKI